MSGHRVNPEHPAPEAGAAEVKPPVKRRKLKRRSLPLWLLLLAVLLWLLTLAIRVGTMHRQPLATWSCWRLADQELRLSGYEIPAMPAAFFPRDELWDRKELMKRWAGKLEEDGYLRSLAGAAILWHRAGEEERAQAAFREDPEEPVRSYLIRVLLDGGQADAEQLSWWAEYLRTTPAEFYWWEEQLGVELAARSQDRTLPLMEKAAERRNRHRLDAAVWRTGLEIALAVAGSLVLGIYLWRRRGRLCWHRVPGGFQWIGWRRLIAGLAAGEVLAFVSMLLFSRHFAVAFEWTRRDQIVYATLASWFVPVVLILVFFVNPVKALRALRLGCRFDFAPVFGFFGLSIVVASLCHWLLPWGQENQMGFGVDPMTFGVAGLWHALWLGCVVAPLGEEIVFRGFLFNGIAARLGMLPGLVMSSAVFAAVHGYGWSGTASVFAGGVLASLLYRLSGSLGAPVLFHALFNLLAFSGTWITLEAPYW